MLNNKEFHLHTHGFVTGRPITVRSLHVQLHVALLSEADGAHLATVGFLARVFHPVNM